MKNLILVTILTIMSLPAFTQTTSVCVDDDGGGAQKSKKSEEMVTPCFYEDLDARSSTIEMMFANLKGMKAVKAKTKNGMLLGDIFSEDKDLVVTLFKLTRNQVDDDENFPGGWKIEIIVKYEITLTDCQNTDVCDGTYIWEVTEKTLGDGYLATTTYTNKIYDKK